MTPSISVVIPVYNGGHLLKTALASIFGQTVLPTEVIVVNDGSTDDTEIQLRELAHELPNTFRWTSQDHAGEAAARNTGLALAGGDLIAFLDHDDRWHPTKLERQLEQLDSEPALALSFTDYVRNATTGSVRIGHDTWDPSPEAVFEALTSSCALGIPTVLARRAAFDRVPPFDERLRMGTDWQMWLHMSAAGIRFGHLPEALVECHWDGTNVSSDRRLYYEQACEMFDRFFDDSSLPQYVRSGSGRCRAHWHLRAAIHASQTGDKAVARRHIWAAARARPTSVRAGWTRMLGIGLSPP